MTMKGFTVILFLHAIFGDNGIGRYGSIRSNNVVGIAQALSQQQQQKRQSSSYGNKNNNLSFGTKRSAVIVGGGPAGIAAAKVLASKEEFDEITILESSSSMPSSFPTASSRTVTPPSSSSFDPARAYFYNINKRGQMFTDKFNINLSVIGGVGITKFARFNVPADPEIVFDDTAVPFSRDLSKEEQDQMGTLYWIPRHDFVRSFMDLINDDDDNDKDCNRKIRIRFGVHCEHIEPTTDGKVCVVSSITTTNEKREEIITPKNIIADLCVGADGLNSKVRQSLENGRFDDWMVKNKRNQDKFFERCSSKDFRLKQYKSPSTGLRIKGLQLLPNFKIPVTGAAKVRETEIDTTRTATTNASTPKYIDLDNNYTYSILSTTTGPQDSLVLSLMPQKGDEEEGRPINLCTMPDHILWKIKDGPSMKAYFQKAFPRFDWDTIVDPNEWDKLAKAEGSVFPFCQYSPRLHVSSSTGDGGVVLVGDALHAFPPDIGQGVNAALSDVMTLDKCFSDTMATAAGSDNSSNKNNIIRNALSMYECENGPETRALIALARCGAPFQYNQPSKYMKFRKLLWTFNVATRLLLNKLTLGVSPKPAIITQLNSSLSFRDVMRGANTLTVVLSMGLGLILSKIFHNSKLLYLPLL